jgi:16S rRNA (cytosine1402-N4)-methyltransferase
LEDGSEGFIPPAPDFWLPTPVFRIIYQSTGSLDETNKFENNKPIVMYHKPVLLTQSIEGLNIRPQGTYVDVTYGGGGHSREILNKLDHGRLYGFDQDQDALANKIDDERLVLINHNFRFLKNFLKYHDALPVDGILADLGVSSHQFDVAERGFSIRFPGELDLRMNRNQKLTAATVLNEYDQDKLTAIFREYGDLSNGRAIASSIVKFRINQPLINFEDLRQALSHFPTPGRENKFFAKVLQALRIEINRELEALKEFLLQVPDVLKTGGRLVVISYHSLEDRLVKNFMKSGNFEGKPEKDFYGNVDTPFQLINKKPLIPGDDEVKENNRARSAKLRIAEKR